MSKELGGYRRKPGQEGCGSDQGWLLFKKECLSQEAALSSLLQPLVLVTGVVVVDPRKQDISPSPFAWGGEGGTEVA
jgi:hypothetical protein